MKVLLTGGAGFIGSSMLHKLNQRGIKDIFVVDELGSSEKWKNLRGKIFEDYFEKDKLLEILEKGTLNKEIDVIIHFGACTSTTENNASYMMENNYIYSRKIAEWALTQKKRLIYASSAATYGMGEKGYSDKDEDTLALTPLNIYGYSKHLFDLWVIKNKLEKQFTGFKFFNVFGPNEYHKGDMMSMVSKGYMQIKSTGKMRLFKSYKAEYKDGEQKRDFVYVKDAVEVVQYFLENPSKKGIFNLGTGSTKTWNDLANAIFSALGMKPKIEYFDMPDVLKGKYQYFTQAELGKLRESGCNHKFMSLEDAVHDYVGYLEKNTYL